MAAPPQAELVAAAFRRRPVSAVTRLAGRQLLLLSARDVLRAAAEEGALLVALVAPAPAALQGFARAARACGAPLLFVRPSGSAGERGPEEAREDTAFIEQALRAADEARFTGPLVLLKEPPWAGNPVLSEQDRVVQEIEAGFTGVGITARPDNKNSARDAALVASAVCSLELGLEVVPAGGTIEVAKELVQGLRSRGSSPSALRLTGNEEHARALGRELAPVAISTASETEPEALLGRGVRQLVAVAPFLRALSRAAPAELLTRLQAWADEKHATLEQAAARHQRLLRELPGPAQEKLEALCCFEAGDLLRVAGAAGTGTRIAARIGALAREAS